VAKPTSYGIATPLCIWRSIAAVAVKNVAHAPKEHVALQIETPAKYSLEIDEVFFIFPIILFMNTHKYGNLKKRISIIERRELG
jgi:hypothetical protein